VYPCAGASSLAPRLSCRGPTGCHVTPQCLRSLAGGPRPPEWIETHQLPNSKLNLSGASLRLGKPQPLVLPPEPGQGFATGGVTGRFPLGRVPVAIPLSHRGAPGHNGPGRRRQWAVGVAVLHGGVDALRGVHPWRDAGVMAVPPRVLRFPLQCPPARQAWAVLKGQCSSARFLPQAPPGVPRPRWPPR
jgi:hypothetical protein